MSFQPPRGTGPTVLLPEAENTLSRRYLRLLLRWLPVPLRTFQTWAGRPRCGHFFGGVYWYGQETSRTIATLALVASSPEFDARLAGESASTVRHLALQGLRYLCFTHDTGPADCLRPRESWGRPEPAGTKWGERGQGFFRTSQCGCTLAHLALTAALLPDLLGAEEQTMLATIAADYLDRFGTMAPRSGTYNDTQTEENAWTALGLVASLLLLPEWQRTPAAWEQAQGWMFRTTTRPQDMYNLGGLSNGKTIRDLCAGTFTTLPDGTAENHGFVHPTYMASALITGGETMNLLQLFQSPLPPHLFWRRREGYEILKRWCDTTGVPHAPQGMDWPYFSYPGYSFLHTVAQLYLHDPDAAYFAQRVLAVLERASVAHDGALVPAEVSRVCHTFQDPALMNETSAVGLAQSYLAHRLMGAGTPPPTRDEVEARLRGVHVYSHGGFLLHRHARGQTSLSWRNRTMVLPSTTDGLALIGPRAGSCLADITVTERPASTQLIALTIREASDRVSVVLIQHLAQSSVERQVLFASLPDGKSVIVERLLALQSIQVESVTQGLLSIINDGYFAAGPPLQGQRRLFWEGGERLCRGYVTDAPREDVVVNIRQSRWVNVDDRCGVVFRGSGRTLYRNRHYFPVWRAVEDDLILSLQDEWQVYDRGDTIASLVTLWCPQQTHQETARQALILHDSPVHAVVVEVDGLLCAGNFHTAPVVMPGPMTLPVHALLPLARASGGDTTAMLHVTLQLPPREPLLLTLQ